MPTSFGQRPLQTAAQAAASCCKLLQTAANCLQQRRALAVAGFFAGRSWPLQAARVWRASPGSKGVLGISTRKASLPIQGG
eukprot:8743796-Alexandrium_andersonii.AAC.1